MDTSHFIMALQRFMARRGQPRTIQSDGGKSLVAGGKEISRLIRVEEIRAHCARKWGIEFSINPPGSPHWGGSWERMIADIRRCLDACFRSMSGKLTLEAFQTSLASIEAQINKRPIAFDGDGVPICPAQLLNPLSADTMDLPWQLSSLAMVRLVGEIARNFWKRWKQFYLSFISAERVLARGQDISLQPGDLVLVDNKGGNVFTNEWTKGKVVEVHPSQDGKVRLITVETARGVVRLGLNRIALTEATIEQRPSVVGS
jgi:hypothetical protein